MLKESTSGTNKSLDASASNWQREGLRRTKTAIFFEKMSNEEVLSYGDYKKLVKLLQGQNNIAMWTFLNERKITPLTKVGEQN